MERNNQNWEQDKSIKRMLMSVLNVTYLCGLSLNPQRFRSRLMVVIMGFGSVALRSSHPDFQGSI